MLNRRSFLGALAAVLAAPAAIVKALTAPKPAAPAPRTMTELSILRANERGSFEDFVTTNTFESSGTITPEDIRNAYALMLKNPYVDQVELAKRINRAFGV